MNWMNGLCLLIGLGIGMEIMWCVMKYRFDNVAENIDKLHDGLIDAIDVNKRVLNGWGDTIKHCTEIIEFNRELIEQLNDKDDGKGDAEHE